MRTTQSIAFNNKQNQTKKTPFCAFCFNLGKSPAIYNSHYIRETPAKDSRIVCPELKSCKCMGCGKQGHTVSNCRSTKSDHRMGEHQRQGIDAPYKNRHDQNPTKMHKIQPKNIYSLLTEDENEDDETDTMVSEISYENVSIASSATTENDVSMKSYAAALMSIFQQKQPANPIQPQIQPSTAQTKKYDFSVFKNTKRYASWADAESSDDEE